ncbi:sensor histidine kinase KdpD [uncultured Clostridium sp.]|uniref:sensor histidine kinase KdpD n=1 Tax=Clostridium disporicum TaxID=84024 RepID=UPI0025EF3976|nr:sensor histidine kinase KdpD [uncultured Clostridium sp.]MDU2288723.1 sensor histidine kinase KdpD [Clostridium celatum]
MMEEDNRHNSRQLLKMVENEEGYLKKGKLKVFFGYAAGVGKTYAMLQEAHELKNNNVDVVVGYIERHTRKDTLELINGLEILSTRKVDYKGVEIDEFDLNSALERSPDVLLVDELPHTNPPRFRHKKRWQDIEELLDAGINVYTTLNVQHLESLNDVIASITGVFVKETVPDYIVDKADKIELIDIAIGDLRKRFDEGKIYKKENVDKAKSNFFTDDNLKALRELSLRKTADTVNSVVQISRLSKGNINILPTKEKIVACISSSPSSSTVIRNAARMASSFKTEWIALYVGNLNSKTMTDEEKTKRTYKFSRKTRGYS